MLFWEPRPVRMLAQEPWTRHSAALCAAQCCNVWQLLLQYTGKGLAGTSTATLSWLGLTCSCRACRCTPQVVAKGSGEGHVAPVRQGCDHQAAIQPHELVAILEHASALPNREVILYTGMPSSRAQTNMLTQVNGATRTAAAHLINVAWGAAVAAVAQQAQQWQLNLPACPCRASWPSPVTPHLCLVPVEAQLTLPGKLPGVHDAVTHELVNDIARVHVCDHESVDLAPRLTAQLATHLQQ